MTQLVESARDGPREGIEVDRLDTMVNRLGQSLLCGALFLGSSWMLSAKAPPLVGDASLFGAIAMVLALFLGSRLLAAFPQSGGLRRDDY